MEILKERFHLLQAVRSFFAKRGVIEVDCPLISLSRIVEPNIELIPVWVNEKRGWLYPSAEVGMKKLLSKGMGDLFQLSHVFRNGEKGSKHNTEFTMLEWYRIGMDFEDILTETLDLLSLCGDFPRNRFTYTNLFEQYFQINPHSCSRDELIKKIKNQPSLCPYSGLFEESKDHILHFLMGSFIEKKFKPNEWTIVTDYPASQTLMSDLKQVDQYQVANRFEIYFGDLELANGSKESTNRTEQITQLKKAHSEYCQDKGDTFDLDLEFLQTIEQGIPDCSGVALGFDRLCMIKTGCASIQEVIV